MVLAFKQRMFGSTSLLRIVFLFVRSVLINYTFCLRLVTNDADGEIDDPSMEEMVQSSDSEVNKSGEYSGTSSEVTGMESDGTEVQSKGHSSSLTLL